MVKKLVFLFLGLCVAFLLLDSKFNSAISNSNGAPAGYTGSPGDGKTCGTNGGCHGGGATVQAGWITSNIPVNGYIPGSVYTITATVIYAGRVKFGFEISPQSSSGALLGSLTITNPTETQLVGTKYISHTVNGTSGSGSRSWSFDWTAPAASTGSVTFYAAFNATNNNFGSGGDVIYTSSLSVQEAPTAIIIGKGKENKVIIFPNPASDFIYINYTLINQQNVSISLYDIYGKKIDAIISENKLPGIYSEKIYVKDKYPMGIYFIHFSDGMNDIMKKIVVI